MTGPKPDSGPGDDDDSIDSSFMSGVYPVDAVPAPGVTSPMRSRPPGERRTLFGDSRSSSDGVPPPEPRRFDPAEPGARGTFKLAGDLPVGGPVPAFGRAHLAGSTDTDRIFPGLRRGGGNGRHVGGCVSLHLKRWCPRLTLARC